MAVSVDEIRGSINMAREMALTGNYDSSLVYYEGAKLQLGRFLSTVDTQARRESWRAVNIVYNSIRRVRVLTFVYLFFIFLLDSTSNK